MANLIFLDPGSSATFDQKLWTGGSFGTVTSDNGVTHGQPRSIKVYTDGSDRGVIANGVLADAGRRISFFYYVDAYELSTGIILQVRQAGGNTVFQLNLTATGVLQLSNGVSQIGSDGATVALGTWTRISVSYTVTSTTVYSVRLFVNGNPSASGDNTPPTLSNTTSAQLQMGWFGLSGGNNKSAYFSDVYIDDGATLDDPGGGVADACRVTAKPSAAVNENTFDTTGGSGAVNERPLDEGNYKQHAADASQVSQSYAIQTAAGGDVDISSATQIGYMGWIWAKGAAGGSGTPKITVNGADTAITLTSSPALYSACVTSATYPADAATIGMVSTGTADDTFLYECGIVVAYTPSGATPKSGSESDAVGVTDAFVSPIAVGVAVSE